MSEKFSTLRQKVLERWHKAAEVEGIPKDAYKPNIRIVESNANPGYVFGIIHNENRFNRPTSQENIKESSNSIRIVQIDLKGNLTSEWNSMIDAQRELNYDCGAISKCCNKINKTYKGYLWFFASEYYSTEFNIDTFINRPKRENSIKCAVLQIDPHSKNVIKKWDNIDDAVKVLNLNKSTLLCCCRGKYKTHKNFIWKFVD